MKTIFVTKEQVEQIAATYPTPFHLYDEKGIRDNVKALKDAFAWNEGFREYFAVKATPNPYLIKILNEYGCGCDCSSMTELMLSEAIGAVGEEIMFSSNATPAEEFVYANKLGAIINLDDLSHCFSDYEGSIFIILKRGSTYHMYTPTINKKSDSGHEHDNYLTKLDAEADFEEIGFKYVGPIDGHNIEDLEHIFKEVKKINEPILVHVLTKKGKGYEFSEEHPTNINNKRRIEIFLSIKSSFQIDIKIYFNYIRYKL